MARLQLSGITKRYGDFKAADDISLDIADGEFIVLLGPSGCGKTTTLRIVAGFIEPTSGRVRLGERDITALPPWKRNAGLVFQSYALFPHMTVAENVGFGLEMRMMPKAQMAPKITEALRLVRLEHLGDRLPRQLSGGQQQRVALARALVFRPDVLLLDEPLSNLDAKLRQDVRVEIRELQRRDVPAYLAKFGGELQNRINQASSPYRCLRFSVNTEISRSGRLRKVPQRPLPASSSG
jgi:putative spermidine/putrescine transport system ATP-binding protein